MRQEALLYVGAMILSIAFFGLTGAVGLAIYGAIWLIWGK